MIDSSDFAISANPSCFASSLTNCPMIEWATLPVPADGSAASDFGLSDALTTHRSDDTLDVIANLRSSQALRLILCP